MLVLLIFPLLSLLSFVFLVSVNTRVLDGRLGAGFILWISYTALSGRILSAIGELNNAWIWLAVELIPPILVLLLFRYELKATFTSVTSQIAKAKREFKESMSIVWSLPILMVATAMYYGIGLAANLTIPQSMDDSLTAYLARAGFWISSGSIDFFKTSNYNFPLVSYPALPTLSTVRWIIITGTDRSASLDQWVATLIAATLVYQIARRIKISKSAALTISSIWLLAPVVLLQSQTVLNDMVALVAVLTAILFGSRLFGDFQIFNFSIAFLATFVAVGTKQTVLFMVPPALLVLFIAQVKFRNKGILEIFQNRLRVFYFVLLTAVGLFISFPEYFFNQIRFDHPLGPSESFGYFADTSAGLQERISAIGVNSRTVFTAGFFGDVPRKIAERFPDFFEIVRQYYPEAGYEVSRISGVGWFGFSVTLLSLVGISASLVIAKSRSDLFGPFLLLIGGMLYAILFLYTRPNFSKAFSRYMLFPITIFFILGGYSIEILLRSKRRSITKFFSQGLILCLAVIAILQGGWSFLGNGLRPLVGSNTVWKATDEDVFQRSNGFVDFGAVLPIVKSVNECLSEQDKLAISLPYKFPLSLLFGDSYTRSVKMVNFSSETAIDAEFVESQGYSALILHDDVKSEVTISEDQLDVMSSGPYTLVTVLSRLENCG